MTVLFDRTKFFNSVRASLFGGSIKDQLTVDGMNYKLDVWEEKFPDKDVRWLAYAFATSHHETGSRVYPVREGFCESDADARAYVKKAGYSYAVPDPTTGEVYYGRGDVQMTWADNYKKATSELGLTGAYDLYYNPEAALEDDISANCMYNGMIKGWYRASSDGKRQTLDRYFNNTTDDAYGAREIINGDKSKVPSWSNGVSIGNLIKGYHQKYYTALQAAWITQPLPPEPAPELEPITMTVAAAQPVIINGVTVWPLSG